jgi:hypothetical protein
MKRIVGILTVMVSLSAASAWAQLSGSTSDTTGATCSGGGVGDGDCRNSTQQLTNTATTFQSRYAWNINADTGIFSTHDTSGSARHNVTFNATAPGGYRLDISTSRVGALGRSEDASNCSGSADTSGVTGNSNVAVNSGTLGLADPGGISPGGGDANVPFSQSATATIFRVSNGSVQSHSLSFTWNGAVRSNSCEASVRQGESSVTTSGCGVCGYPGTPSRNQASDGHFVTVSFTSLCGNGTIDSAVSEQCDQGSANGSFGSCCNTNCSFKASGTTCRNAAGVCDVAETCTGSTATCPADAFEPSSTVCRGSAGVCDVAEHCTGSGINCPADGKSTAVCRAAAGACDLAESCNGITNDCPPDLFQPPGALCRIALGACDQVEDCSGVDPTCPPDAVFPAGTECRAAVGTCDVAESCDGTSSACPADAFQPSGVTCRASAGDCDVAESCPGTSGNCPADTFQPATVQCRAATGVCDVAENCTGSSAACPADSVAGAFVECRAASGDCDQAENCDGGSKNCPADVFKPSGTLCRASGGACDVAETCTGSSTTCPANAFEPATTTCRASTGPCDVAESCTGSGPACPGDATAPAGTTCRAATNTCDVAETCNGTSTACPVDAFQPDGTACNDNNVCSSPDTCQGGVCVGTPQNCADHYLCYKTKPASPFTPIPNVHLVDQFEDIHADVRKPKLLCPPADKNGEGIVDDVTHLEAYTIKAVAGTPKFVRRTNIQVTNQFNPTTPLRVDAYKRDLLLVPSNKNLTGPTTPPDNNAINVDHYKCYKVKTTPGTPRFTVQTVTVGDQFNNPPKIFVLKKIKHLCTPVDKNGEGTKNADGHLACYQAKGASGQPKHVRRLGVNINNQFGPLVLGTVKESELCIPSLKTLTP